ncbi:MAG: hypothetical protein VYE16_03075, partial [Cyanobacteriota bacterium]|nr:hypothetical protein [Cyanobacteriota bacterium]
MHSNNLIPEEESEELELQIYEQFEAQENEPGAISEEAGAMLVTAVVVIAVPVAPLAIVYVWASSLASDQSDSQPESGTRNSYTADDASASTSSATDDVLISVRWQHAEDDLNWAFVVMKLSVGDNTYDCSTAGDQECAIGQDGNDHALWETGEFLTLSESGSDIA